MQTCGRTTAPWRQAWPSPASSRPPRPSWGARPWRSSGPRASAGAWCASPWTSECPGVCSPPEGRGWQGQGRGEGMPAPRAGLEREGPCRAAALLGAPVQAEREGRARGGGPCPSQPPHSCAAARVFQSRPSHDRELGGGSGRRSASPPTDRERCDRRHQGAGRPTAATRWVGGPPCAAPGRGARPSGPSRPEAAVPLLDGTQPPSAGRRRLRLRGFAADSQAASPRFLELPEEASGVTGPQGEVESEPSCAVSPACGFSMLPSGRRCVTACPHPGQLGRGRGDRQSGVCSLRFPRWDAGGGVAGSSCRCAPGPGPGGGLLSLFPHERTALTVATIHGTRGAQAVTPGHAPGALRPVLASSARSRTQAREPPSPAGVGCRPLSLAGHGAGVSSGRAGGSGAPAPSVSSSRRVPIFGLEAIWRDGHVVGHTRRAGFGFAIDKSIAYGYVRDPSGGLVSPVPSPAKEGRAPQPPSVQGGGPCLRVQSASAPVFSS